MEDQKILDLYWQRDPQAIEQTGKKYGGYCFRVAQNILSSPKDAEECVSDTWLGAWNTIPPRRPGCLRLYLARLTRNLSFTRYRAMTAEKRGGGQLEPVLEELSECLASETDLEGEVIAAELKQSVRRFTSALPEREANVFVRRYFYAEPVEQIAVRYGLTANHTSVILCRTRKKLKAHLTQEGYFDEQK